MDAPQKTVDSDNIPTKEKEFRFASGGLMEVKSLDGELVIKGYIATTHKDSVNDVITKETLSLWAKEINDGLPRANKVTYHHDRSDPKVVGVGMKGSARVDSFPDGEFGLYVETIVNKAHELYKDIEYEYSIDALDSFSIEFIHPEHKDSEDTSLRVLGTETDLYGWTLASRPVNDNAVVVKELLDSHKLSSQEQREVNKMSEEQTEKIEALETQLKELQSKVQVKEEEEAKVAEEAEAEQATEAEEKEKAEQAAVEAKEVETEKQFTELKAAIAEIKESKGPELELEEKEDKMKPEVKELQVAMKEALGTKDMAAEVGAYLDKRGISEAYHGLHDTKEKSPSEFKLNMRLIQVEGKESIEFKGLSVGDNVNTNYINATTEIGLSQAELQDVVMPVIFNALNESTVTWDLLAKDNMGAQGTNRVTFVLKTANTGAYFSKGNSITATETDREKYTIEYKKVYIGGAVDGDLQAYSRGAPFGEALALEIADRTIALKKKMNQALFDEQAGLKAGTQPLGIPAITDSAGNTSLYDTTRSAANKLAPTSAGDTYVDASGGLTEPMLRNAIEQATTDGSMLDDLMFVGTPAVVNKYKALFDNKERLVPYSPRAGFKNAPDFEGVPLFGDVDSKADSLFLIDTRALRIAILVPPTVEMLGKRADADEFYVKSYYAVYCVAPRRNVEMYDIA